MNNQSQGLNLCPIPVLGYRECDTSIYSFEGAILSGKTWDFTPAINQPYWALGFEFLGRQYAQLGLGKTNNYFDGVSAPTNPPAINAQQALFFQTLQLYNCTAVNSTTAQMTDSYNTPSGIVQTEFQVAFNISAKTITIQNLMTKLPQQSSFRACNEVLLSQWKAFLIQFAVVPGSISIPYVF
jgi:hypothetical protein